MYFAATVDFGRIEAVTGRALRRIGWAVLAALAVWAARGPAWAEAHAMLVSAYPAPGASLTATPVEIRLTFSERIGAGSSVLLFGPQFRAIAGVTSGPDPAAPEQLRAFPPQLPPDTYTVEWRAVSVDGHDVSGSYAFAITAPAAASSASPLWWVAGGLALIVIIAGGAGWTLARRRRARATGGSG
jgi:methionine-rich copper-binding protein CopC